MRRRAQITDAELNRVLRWDSHWLRRLGFMRNLLWVALMTKIPDDANALALTGAMYDVLWCLFKNGATWDGNIPSKTGRAALIEGGLVYHDQGWSILTTYGFHACIAAGMDKKKGTR